MASKRRLRRKACGAKRRFPTKAAARAAMIHLKFAKRSSDTMNTYPCAHCGGHHFGHTPGRTLRAIAARQAEKHL